MAESSWLWNTDGTGDGAATGVTQAQWQKLFRIAATSQEANKGVSWGYLNSLAVARMSDEVGKNVQGAEFKAVARRMASGVRILYFALRRAASLEMG